MPDQHKNVAFMYHCGTHSCMYQVGGLAIIKIMNNGTTALCTAELLFPGGLLGFAIFVVLNCYFHVACLVLLSLYC